LPAPPPTELLADLKKPGISSYEMEMNDDPRAPKRICLTVESSNKGLLHLLTGKLSPLLNFDNAGGLAGLRTALT
jgi:hypothetical protein